MPSPAHTLAIDTSTSLEAACNRFLDAIGAWTLRCREEYSGPATIDNHDQGTYTTAWLPYIAAREDRAAADFMIALRDAIARHHVDSGAWYHGYWKKQEAHHGTEHFELFLRAVWQLAPDDAETIRQMEDAAEHIGNWGDGVPDWYDWEHHCFHSCMLGTEHVDHAPAAHINKPDHLRFVTICLLTHRMTGKQRYRELALDYGRSWAQAIAGNPIIPIGLSREGPLYEVDPESQALYAQWAGAAPPPENAVTRAENLLASDAINVLLALWKLSDEACFRTAAEALLEPIASQLADPDATAASAAIRDYRAATGDTRYDGRVLAAADQQLQTPLPAEFGVDPEPERSPPALGIGKRADAPHWYEDGRPRAHNEALLALAAELRHDRELAAAAVDLARTRFALACTVYPHGRHHGCSARTVNAIARGHGRENHAGTITAVLAPMLAWLGMTPPFPTNPEPK